MMGFWKKKKPLQEPAEPDFTVLKNKLFWNLFQAASELAVFDDEMTKEEAEALRSIRDWAGGKYREQLQAEIDKLE